MQTQKEVFLLGQRATPGARRSRDCGEYLEEIFEAAHGYHRIRTWHWDQMVQIEFVSYEQESFKDWLARTSPTLPDKKLNGNTPSKLLCPAPDAEIINNDFKRHQPQVERVA